MKFIAIIQALPFKGLLLWLGLAFVSYFLIALLNISNEDLYNFELSRIFSEGGLLNQIAILLIPIWLLVNAIVLVAFILKLRKRLYPTNA